MQLAYVDSTLSLTMRLEIGKLEIVFVAFLGIQLVTCFSSFSLGRVIAKFNSCWLYYFRDFLVSLYTS